AKQEQAEQEPADGRNKTGDAQVYMGLGKKDTANHELSVASC
ncbi:MAG: hypothetical protein JWQ78_1607, partial [Sediminibacterium sp.]|nr:hypothetical protein [Sediminibacterium sp.]